ncbi:unnamed protein product, partial [Ectocarpus sp. 8 AP-2014]
VKVSGAARVITARVITAGVITAGISQQEFGTIAMIAEGCIMARICHTNNCPVGVTT